MSKRQREVLRAVRSRDQADASDARVAAQARLDAALSDARALDEQHAQACAPPSAGTVTRVDREARRRHHVAQLRGQIERARGRVDAARATLADAQAVFAERVRDTQAVDVLDARAAQAEHRQAARRSEAAAEERNTQATRDDDALQ